MNPPKKRKIIESYVDNFKPLIFVETGTFLGDTVYYFKDQFKELSFSQNPENNHDIYSDYS